VPSAATGAPALPIMDFSNDDTTMHFTWVAVPGLTDIIVTLNGVRILPGPSPTDWTFDHYIPISKDPIFRVLTYHWTHVNRFGTSPVFGFNWQRQAPPPTNLRATKIAPEAYRLDWDPPYDGPPVLGYIVYLDSVKLKEEVASATTHTTTITVPLGTRANINVAAFYTIPSQDNISGLSKNIQILTQ
jgi:hypothetical protein